MFIDLVDGLPQVMGSLKGLDGRYAYVNEGFRSRIGGSAQIIGATVDDLFSADLAASYRAQDESVLATGRPLRAHLELIVRADGTLGWYVTSKSVVREHDRVLGLAAVSIDLRAQLQSAHAGLAAAIAALREDVRRPWRVPELAAIAGLSQVQLERQCRRTLGISPRSLIQRQRIEHAVQLITTTDATIGEISAACGFYDQSSFTRQFRHLLGLTPGAYRFRRS
jgi:PAS domain S-box-containing protein